MMAEKFSDGELALLREHGIVLLFNRVIFEAQAPMADKDIAAVQAQCAGPIPPALLTLWKLTAGGRLDYDLVLDMDGRQEAVSWTELFFNDSDGYRDLQGWIEHELELAEDAAEDEGEAWDGKLRYLPFGGFEYCDRLYVRVAPGADYGHVVAWKQGLPPAWENAMHSDGVAKVAPGLEQAFAALNLHEDPLAPSGDYFAGQSFLEYVEDHVATHGLARVLADRLIAFYRMAMADWRTPLQNRSLAQLPLLAAIALGHAIRTDDAALVAELAAAGVAFDQPVQGGALATETALLAKAHRALGALIAAGARLPEDALRNIHHDVPAKTVALLLAHGAAPRTGAIVQCAACGAADSARLIAAAYAQCHDDLDIAFAAERDDQLQKLQRDLDQVRKGKLGHYLGENGLAERVRNLQEFLLAG